MIGEIRLAAPYFQQIALHFKIFKIVDTQLQNNLHSTLFLKRSVNYFENFGAECHLYKIGCSEFSFTTHWGA